MTSTAIITDNAPDASFLFLPRTGLEVVFARGHGSGNGAVALVDLLWPQRIRGVVRAGLSCWERPALIADAELLVTELVTNALRHGRGDVGVRLSFVNGHLRIEVRDGSPEVPEPQAASSLDEGGRGLFLVEAIADDWGISDDGFITWCALYLHDAP
ncbi:ATP-binding protein [Streptomyces sp. NPDC047070]|uniref:ATP-binding protein n=1 Tax=Streptomyces sp. NPDC047070 TaxID=3154923 RepID=UPI00345607DB